MRLAANSHNRHRQHAAARTATTHRQLGCIGEEAAAVQAVVKRVAHDGGAEALLAHALCRRRHVALQHFVPQALGRGRLAALLIGRVVVLLQELLGRGDELQAGQGRGREDGDAQHGLGCCNVGSSSARLPQPPSSENL